MTCIFACREDTPVAVRVGKHEKKETETGSKLEEAECKVGLTSRLTEAGMDGRIDDKEPRRGGDLDLLRPETRRVRSHG